ncbi:hypothetical protein J437_LFUL003855 [Ladona fulva]|uniref:Peptidase S1 domain-containing protein n=1 Tax=Ladona fulva TaxID=123851 RepID=A0A8K0KG94_LADFU|nr:hypothetical protein J437_LFUL003855 [Ladona fulva]
MLELGGERFSERIALIVFVLAVFSDAVTKRDVEACPGTQKCVTISECRKIQKESNFQMDLSTSVVYPCEEMLPGMICCATSSSQGTVDEEDPGYTITYEDIPLASESVPIALPLKLGNRWKSGDTCGTFRKGNGIEDASYLQFPWLALIGSNDAGGESIQFQCGGTLINHHYVLSSASCLSKMQSPPVMIRLGEYDISKEDDCAHGCTVIDSEVDQIIVHESYDFPLRKNDIALLRLKVSLPKDKGNFSVTPKYGTLSLHSPELCESDLSVSLQPLGEKQLCSRKTRGSCFGDGGGPLMAYFKNGISESAVVAGIISERGPRCNSPFSVDLFTNVALYLDWITNNMKE